MFDYEQLDELDENEQKLRRSQYKPLSYRVSIDTLFACCNNILTLTTRATVNRFFPTGETD